MKIYDILCDSSSLISLTDSDLESIIPFLQKKFPIRFLIPPSVEYEMVTRPIDSDLREFLFSAFKIKKDINNGVITKVSLDVDEETQKLLRIANNIFFAKGKPLRIVHLGEAAMIATAKKLDVNTLLIDERTTRMLIENPFQLKSNFENEFKVNIMMQKKNLNDFIDYVRGMEIIRSSEIVILGYENDFFEGYNDLKVDALRAALYKIKYSGCSVSFEEINSFIGTVK